MSRQPTTLSRPRASRARRGAQMIEFAMILPMFLFLMLFTFDMGRIILVNGVLADATYQAARAGAQVGGGNQGGGGGVSERAFDQAVEELPMVDVSRVTDVQIASGGTCSNSGPHRYVTVSSSYEVDTMTPGLGSMIGVFVEGEWTLRNTAVSRCEIVR